MSFQKSIGLHVIYVHLRPKYIYKSAFLFRFHFLKQKLKSKSIPTSKISTNRAPESIAHNNSITYTILVYLNGINDWQTYKFIIGVSQTNTEDQQRI